MIYLFYQVNPKAFLFFSFFSFITTLIREIIKDCEDVKGDRVHGSLTLPIKYGLFKTKILLLVIFGFMVFMFFNSILYKFDQFSIYGFIFIVIPSFYLAYQVYLADRKIHFRKISTYLKYLMVLGIIGIMFW
jgi:4-hydroxybenzoate polyprenyltransferase